MRRVDTRNIPSNEAVLKDVSFQKEGIEAYGLNPTPLKAASGDVFDRVSKWRLGRLFSAASRYLSYALWKVGF